MTDLIFDSRTLPRLSPAEMDELLEEGWRHFGADFFRYNYSFYEDQLARVLPLRLNLQHFAFSKTQRKILRKNADLQSTIRPLEIDKSKISLFEQHKTKFKDNPPGSIFEVISQQDPPGIPCNTLEISVFEHDRLLACSFMDVTENATSGIYAFYDLAASHRSLGIFTMLLEIDWALQQGKRYYYSGYAYDIPSFYDYKKNFAALEFFDWHNHWLPFAEYF